MKIWLTNAFTSVYPAIAIFILTFCRWEEWEDVACLHTANRVIRKKKNKRARKQTDSRNTKQMDPFIYN